MEGTAHLGVEGGHGVDAVGGCTCAVLDADGGRRVVVGADGTHLDIVRGTPSLLLALGLCVRETRLCQTTLRGGWRRRARGRNAP